MSLQDPLLVPVAAAQEAPGQSFPSHGHCHIGDSCPSREDNYEFHPYNKRDPPTSGLHEECFPTTFISETALPKQILVHILEHGNVEILYNKDASPELIKELRDYAMRYDFRHRRPRANRRTDRLSASLSSTRSSIWGR